jgi:F0F1-type ATP synthase membrane subunit a
MSLRFRLRRLLLSHYDDFPKKTYGVDSYHLLGASLLLLWYSWVVFMGAAFVVAGFAVAGFVTAGASLFQASLLLLLSFRLGIIDSRRLRHQWQEQTLPLILSAFTFFFLINGTPCFRGYVGSSRWISYYNYSAGLSMSMSMLMMYRPRRDRGRSVG